MEFSYAFFCNMAELYQERCAEYLEQLVPHLCENAVRSDNTETKVQDVSEFVSCILDLIIKQIRS